MAEARADPRALTDGVVVLRPPRPDDAGAHWEAVEESLGELRRWLPWARDGYDADRSAEWTRWCAEQWERGTHREWFVVDPDDRLLGSIGVRPKDDGTAEIGYWVRTSAAGRGVCSAAARLAAHWALGGGASCVAIRMEEANVASRRVAEKAGARYDGVDRHTHDDGTEHRLLRYLIEPPPEATRGVASGAWTRSGRSTS